MRKKVKEGKKINNNREEENRRSNRLTEIIIIKLYSNSNMRRVHKPQEMLYDFLFK
jgi:hypothetical protein